LFGSSDIFPDALIFWIKIPPPLACKDLRQGLLVSAPLRFMIERILPTFLVQYHFYKPDQVGGFRVQGCCLLCFAHNLSCGQVLAPSFLPAITGVHSVQVAIGGHSLTVDFEPLALSNSTGQQPTWSHPPTSD